MNDHSSNRSVDDRPESDQESPSRPGASFWADHLMQYNRSFALGHPYLQGQWGRYQEEKRAHILRTVLIVALLVAVGLVSTRIPYYWLYYIIPALCVGCGIFSFRKWKKKNAQLAARAQALQEASEILKNNSSSVVQYSVEDIGQNKMHVLKNAVPHCRIVLEGATSVPKYCGSWPICNWRGLNESDRLGLHSEYREYISGKVWHGVDRSVALLTDSETVLWFV